MGERSIIDYIITERCFHKNVRDVRVRRGSEIYSDHYLVMAKLWIKDTEKVKPQNKVSKKPNERIKSFKLTQPNIAQKYKSIIDNEIEGIQQIEK